MRKLRLCDHTSNVLLVLSVGNSIRQSLPGLSGDDIGRPTSHDAIPSRVRPRTVLGWLEVRGLFMSSVFAPCLMTVLVNHSDREHGVLRPAQHNLVLLWY